MAQTSWHSCDLTSDTYIRQQSNEFIASERIGCLSPKRRFPPAKDLFCLAADAVAGDPSRTPLRLRTARSMAGQASRYLREALGTQTDKSSKATLEHLESGRRQPDEVTLKRLAKVYHVSGNWLRHGGYQGEHNQLDDMPEWLRPWHSRILVATMLVQKVHDKGKARPILDPDMLPPEGASVMLAELDRNPTWDKDFRNMHRATLTEAIIAILQAIRDRRENADTWTKFSFQYA